MGEPAGVGPDIAISAWHELHRQRGMRFALIGSAEILEDRAKMFDRRFAVARIASLQDAESRFATSLPVLDRPLRKKPAPGRIAAENASCVTGFIEEAVDLVLAGQCAAIVTCPIQKETLYAAGFSFEGHTDFLAGLALRRGFPATPVMMLATSGLRTVPVTIHIPLKDVAASLSIPMIVEQTRVTAQGLKTRFGIARPRIGLTGLNPHAGEGGTIGMEEKSIIEPAIAQLRAEGLDIAGPLPGDTAFHDEARAQFDVVICMYHDQALIPVKTLDFHGGVNVTLGLPFIRTSPDHGTALSLAGKGTANPRSLISAIRMAAEMARREET
jgi:4-hydroxythreonine-4-phosphate dehydrogenase